MSTRKASNSRSIGHSSLLAKASRLVPRTSTALGAALAFLGPSAVFAFLRPSSQLASAFSSFVGSARFFFAFGSSGSGFSWASNARSLELVFPFSN